MDKPRTRIWIAVQGAPGVAGHVLLFFSFLSVREAFLADQRSGLDWGLFRATFLAILLFSVATFVTTSSVFRKGRDGPSARIWAAVSVVFGVSELVFLSLAALAPTDISHGERDVRLEWALVRMAFFVTVFSIPAMIISTGLMSRGFSRLDAAGGGGGG